MHRKEAFQILKTIQEEGGIDSVAEITTVTGRSL